MVLPRSLMSSLDTFRELTKRWRVWFACSFMFSGRLLQICWRKETEVWLCHTSFTMSCTQLLSMVVRPFMLNRYSGQLGLIVEVLKVMAGEDQMRFSRRVFICISVRL